MAIKVGGTDVIDNSRGLKNIATVDATTAASITAAGVGGGGSLDFTADEAISAGDPVAVKTNGNIEGISASLSRNNTSNQSFGSLSVYGVGGDFVFNPVRKHYTMYFRNSGNDFRGRTYTFEVDEPNVSNYTAGSQTSIYNSRAGNYFVALYDETYDRDLVLYLDGSNGNVSVALINTLNEDGGAGTYTWYPSLNDTGVIHSSSSWEGYDFCYDAGSGYYFVVTSRYGNDVSITPVQLSGSNSLVVGTTTQIISGQRYAPIKIASNGSGQFLLHARDDGIADQIVVPFTIDTSGGFYSISYTVGSATTVSGDPSNSWDFAQVAYDSDSGKFALIYIQTSGPSQVKMRSATVSSNSVTLNTAVTLSNGNGKAKFIKVGDYGLGVVFRNDDQSRTEFSSVVINSSTGAITFTQNMILSTSTDPYIAHSFAVATSAGLGSSQFTMVADSNSGTNSTSLFYNTVDVNSNSSKVVGFAESAISASSTGSVTVIGGVNDQQSGLTVGSKHYLNAGGGLTTTVGSNTYAGLAISSTELLVKG
jgi:hypothetical protein